MQYRCIAFIVACFAASCTGQTNNNNTASDNSAASLQVVQNMFAAFNRHDWEGMAAYYSNPAEFLDPAYGKSFVTHTRDSVIAKYKELQQMLPDVKDSIVSIFAKDDRVSVEFVSIATLPDGQKFSLPICVVFTVQQNLIVKDATYYDNSGK